MSISSISELLWSIYKRNRLCSVKHLYNVQWFAVHTKMIPWLIWQYQCYATNYAMSSLRRWNISQPNRSLHQITALRVDLISHIRKTTESRVLWTHCTQIRHWLLPLPAIPFGCTDLLLIRECTPSCHDEVYLHTHLICIRPSSWPNARTSRVNNLSRYRLHWVLCEVMPYLVKVFATAS